MSAPVIDYLEEPIFLPVEGEHVFGVWTTARQNPSGTAVVLLTGGAWVPCVNRNRLWVKVARELASHGHASLRFDYHGVGESTGDLTGYRLIHLKPDLIAMIDWIKQQGFRDVVMLGACFGARLAMSIVPLIPEISGLILLAPPVWDSEGASGNVEVGARIKELPAGDILRRLRDKRQRHVIRRILKGRALSVMRGATGRFSEHQKVDQKVGPNFLQTMGGIVDQQTPTLLVYGDNEPMYEDYVEAMQGRLGKIMKDTDELIRIRMLDAPVHRLLPVKVQEEVIREAPKWVMELRSSQTQTGEEALA